ncbi:major facilitator superfamily domain-containing protein [Aspergillus pseudoustus]|uniref:Major facilitator superfamily domain-containing protein n=1 Tax=Aspergillus pseudoustus TaxID=1810923 RepID=A0ABR4KY66_9EURO
MVFFMRSIRSSSETASEKPQQNPTTTPDDAGSTVEGTHSTTLDPAAVRRLNRQLDLHVLPPLFILYFLSFLDRGNIGNARIQGLEASLGMSGQDYSITLCIFFIPYVLFEVPSNLILKRLSPKTWLSILVTGWGIITMCQGFLHNFGQIVALRFILGLFEAGVFPGCMYILAMYYPRFELQWRFGMFFPSSTLAGAFGGLLAYAIVKMDGLGGLDGWRWIFVIEGVVTAAYGICVKWLVPDWPERAKFLTNDERTLQKAKMTQDDGEASMDRLTPAARKRIFLDWKIYLGCIMYIGTINTTYAVSFFVPTIIAQLGFTASDAQLLTIPLYAVAVCIQLAFTYMADRFRNRCFFVLVSMLPGIIGYSILLGSSHVSTQAQYFACFLITITGYTTLPLILAWATNQLVGQYKRSIGVAMVVGGGNCGGIIASNIFLESEAPSYTTGFSVCLGLLLLTAMTSIGFAVGLSLENRARDRGERDYRLTEDQDEADNLGDDHPNYRYAL